MQSKWDGEFSYVHSPKRPLLERDEQLGFLTIFKLAASKRNKSTFVFHAQASLPYLIFFWFLIVVIFRINHKLVYDIHDLHEKDDWSIGFKGFKTSLLRYHVFLQMEKFVFSIKRIQKITVSEGLAATMAVKYNAPKPLVVYNISLSDSSENNVVKKLPASNLLYFGTRERVPLNLIHEIHGCGCELHIYGRGITRDWLSEHVPESLLSCVKIFGEYHPSDLNFIRNYAVTLIYSPGVETLNFKFSMPNKLFQALQAGASVLVSSNFAEMYSSFPNLGGAVGILSPGDLLSSIEETLSRRPPEYYKLLKGELDAVYTESRRKYLSAVEIS